MTTVREATFGLLRSFKMTTVFGNPGSTEIPFLREFPGDFRYVLGLHEGAVVGMADGYAQGTGNAAFVNLHTVPGLGNAASAIATAHGNKTPLVIVAGQQDRRHLALEPFLSGRLTEMAPPYVKWSHQPARAEDVPAAIARAYHLAMHPPRGPAFVSVPMDDWDAETAPYEAREVDHRALPSPERLEQVARSLESARSPAIVAGSGAGRAGAWRDAVALAEKLRTPVWADPFGPQAGFPQDHPLFQGYLTAAQATLAEQLATHDLVLVLGAPVFRYYGYVPGPTVSPETRIFHVTDDPEEAARAPAGASVVGDVALAMRHLLGLVSETDRPHPPSSPPLQIPEAKTPLPVEYVLHALDEHLPELAIVVEETPSSKMLLHKHVRVREPDGFYSAAGGGLGFAAAASVGLKLASPDRPVVCVVGDGSLMYGLQALWSAARYGAAVTYVVLNNGRYRILGLLAERDGAGGTVPGTEIPGLDVPGAARSLGCAAETVETPEELSGVLERALAPEGPFVLDVRVDPAAPKSL